MAELARGTVTDRPWGKTLGALGMRGLTGQLTLVDGARRYDIAFDRGAVIAAASPLASEAAARVALTSGLVSSSQVAEIAKRQAAMPGRDEIEVIGELARLTPDQQLRLRRRVIAQRAARTFSVDRGEFVVDDRSTLAVVAGTEMDVRGVIYLGARQNLSEARLASELATFGTSFRLRPQAVEDLPQFGFTDAERPLLERLRGGAALDELGNAGIDLRIVRAALYALAACGALDMEGGTAPRPAASASTRTQELGKPLPRTASRPGTPPPVAATRARPAPPTMEPATTLRRRANTPPPVPARRRTDSAGASEVERLIESRAALLERDATHFELLGVSRDVSPDELRKAYFALARQLHPDRLSALGIADESRRVQRLFAEINAAFAELSDPARRHAYTQILERGGAAVVAAEQAQAEAIASRIVAAEDAFRRGEAALRRDQLTTATAELAHAMQLNPDEADYVALHAWAQFLASSDKLAIAPQIRASLERAIAQSPRAVTARFYLGRVERMLGNDTDALRHFKDVLQRQPGHAEAGSETRVIEQRLAAGTDKDKGLFGRLKR